jgi:hypothetical protein
MMLYLIGWYVAIRYFFRFIAIYSLTYKKPEEINPKDGNYIAEEEFALSTPSDKDNSYNNDYHIQKEKGKQKRLDLLNDDDEDLEYQPVNKKKKVGNQKFISQTQQNDWNSDEYIEAKNSLFTEKELHSNNNNNNNNNNRANNNNKKLTSAKKEVIPKGTSKRAPPKGKQTRNVSKAVKKNRTLVLSEDDSF